MANLTEYFDALRPRITNAGKEYTKKLFAQFDVEIRRMPHRPKNRNVIDFLHISKAAGTEIARISKIIKHVQNEFFIRLNPHDTTLRDIPKNSPYFFSIRDPISRFKSGFYCRKRRGQPRYYNPWTKQEEAAFEVFEHANDLAESLFSDGKLGHAAFAAIKSISHNAADQTFWIMNQGGFLDHRPPLCIIRQEHFDTDIRAFYKCIHIQNPPERQKSEGSSHKYSYKGAPELSEKAVENLSAWYRQDIEMYKWCNRWIEEHQNFE